jgi:hypothetical protein
MQEEQISKVLNAHGHSSAIGDANAEHDIYDDDAISDYPQSGERINLQALRSLIPTSRPAEGADQCRITRVLFGASSDA